jgi:hypothetical protein
MSQESTQPTANQQQQQLEMHIRIKRAETVLFLYVDPSDTVRDIKEKVETLLGQPGSRQRLLKGDRVLEGEGSKLSELSVEYDDELLLVYQKEGSDEWESPDQSLLTNRPTAKLA